MAGTNVDALNGFFKEVSGELVDAVPESGMLLQMVPWSKGNRIGDSFHEAIILSSEQGFSYGGTTGDSFDLNSAISMATKDASISAYSYCLQSSISYTAITRAQSAGKEAFGNAVTTLVENVMESCGKRLEISCLYGQKPLAVVADDNAFDKDDATTATLQITDATWAPGIWCGAEGAQLHLYDADDGTTLISSGSDAVFTVSAVDNENKTIVVTGSSTGITALETAIEGGGVHLYFKDSKANGDMAGLQKIFTNTGSLFGIDAGAFGLWKGQSFDVAGNLTMNKVLRYVSLLVGRGLRGDVTLMISPLTWATLEQEQAALRVFDSSYKPSVGEAGVESIKYRGQNGVIDVVSNPIVQEGHGFLFQPKYLKRIGSAEMLKNPQNQDPFFPITDKAAVGFRVFTDQAIYCQRPARTAFLSGITN